MHKATPENPNIGAVPGTPGTASGIGEKSRVPGVEAVKQFFLKELEKNYGIRYVGNHQYEINRGDVIYCGPLDFVLEVYRGVSKPGGSE